MTQLRIDPISTTVQSRRSANCAILAGLEFCNSSSAFYNKTVNVNLNFAEAVTEHGHSDMSLTNLKGTNRASKSTCGVDFIKYYV